MNFACSVCMPTESIVSCLSSDYSGCRREHASHISAFPRGLSVLGVRIAHWRAYRTWHRLVGAVGGPNLQLGYCCHPSCNHYSSGLSCWLCYTGIERLFTAVG